MLHITDVFASYDTLLASTVKQISCCDEDYLHESHRHTHTLYVKTTQTLNFTTEVSNTVKLVSQRAKPLNFNFPGPSPFAGRMDSHSALPTVTCA